MIKEWREANKKLLADIKKNTEPKRSIGKKKLLFIDLQRVEAEYTNDFHDTLRQLLGCNDDELKLEFEYIKKYLSEYDRNILDLLLEGHNQSQISEILEVHKSTISRRVTKIKSICRKLLK